jgi:hypothetical protein
MRAWRGLIIGASLLTAAGLAACEGDDPPDDPVVTSGAQPASAAMRRLLARQYVNTVELIFGKKAASVALPPDDTALNGYQSIAASQLALNDELVAQYEMSARAVAEAAMADTEHIQALIDCDPTQKGKNVCFERFVEDVGRLAFRRPLTEEERTDFVTVGEAGVDQLGTFEDGIQYIIVALLQSPSFLFQVEIGDPVGEADSVRKLNGYEVASRLSFFLLDRGPDRELLDAAAAGELETEEGVRAHARRLVKLSKAREATAAFFTEYFVLGDIEVMPKDPTLFPDYSQDVALSMRRETMTLINDVIWDRNAPVTELLTADYSFIDEHLAALYDVDAPAKAWSSVTLPEKQQRSGILSHASILATQAHADSTSVTHRGIFILERLLCSSMPPPPEDVDTELPPSSEAPTMRERVAVHLENDSCAGCHRLVDGMGLALENFDPVGRWREKENGEVIDASGEHSDLGEFVGVAGLSQALVESEEATQCMVRNLYRHGTGHVETKAERETLRTLHDKFRESGFKWRELLVEMAASPLMRSVGPKEAEE